MKETHFKNTEIGAIPADWEVTTIEESCYVNSRRGEIPKLFYYIDLDSVSKGKWNKGDIVERENAPSRAQRQFEKGDTLYQTVRPYQVNNLFVDFECDDIIASTGYAVLHPTIRLNNLYLYYYVQEDYFVKRVCDLSIGTGYPTINPSDLKSLPIALPPLKEQEKIAAALSDIDALIKELGELIEKKRLIKQGAMQQLLSGKTRLPGFSKPWIEKRLGDLLKYEQPQKYIVNSTDYSDQGIPVLTAGKAPVLGYTNEKSGIYQNLPCILFDDFLTTSKYIDYPFKVKSSAIKILTLNNVNYNFYLIYALMQRIGYIPGDHQRHWIGIYSDFTITIPEDCQEQCRIADILTDMDNEIAELESKREKYQSIKQGMMQELLTGRIRLVEPSVSNDLMINYCHEPSISRHAAEP